MAVATKPARRTITALDGGDRLVRITGMVAPRFRNGYAIITSPPKDTGQFLIPRWEDLLYVLPPGVPRKNFKRTPDQLRLQRVPDVFSALRQTEHICRGYGHDFSAGEKAVLAELGATALGLNLAVLGMAPGTSIAETQARLADLVNYFSDLVGQPIDLPKREALEQVQATGVGHDSRRRANPSALAARIVAARRRVAERQAAIARIEPYIVARRRRLLSLIHKAKHAMETLDHFLGNLIKEDIWSRVGSAATAPITAHLSALAENIRAITWNPYREFCLETYKDLCRARSEISFRQLAQARTLLQVCASALRIKRVQVELERQIFRLTWLLDAGTELGEDAVRNLRSSIGGLRTALSTVDESRFRKPVTGKALRYLNIAIFDLDHPETFHRGSPNQYLRATREAMKRASAAL